MNERHEESMDIGSAPGLDNEANTFPWGGVRNYLIGLALSTILTGAAFYFVQSTWLWEPSIPVALSVLAVSQIGVHLVFFLHLTTGQDNVNNTLALAFGTLIVTLVIGGTLWISYNMNLHMPMAGHMSPVSGATMAPHEAIPRAMNQTVRVEARSRISGKVTSISCEIGMLVKKGQTCAVIDSPELELSRASAEQALLAIQARLQRDKEFAGKFKVSDTGKKATAARTRVLSDQEALVSISNAMEDARKKAEEARIIAPIDGIVLSKGVQVGQTVGPDTSDPLFVFGAQM